VSLCLSIVHSRNALRCNLLVPHFTFDPSALNEWHGVALLRLPVDCHWLALAYAFCPHWKKLVRVSPGFAAHRLAAHSQYTANSCCSELCKLVFRCLSKKKKRRVLLSAAAFVVIVNRRKQENPIHSEKLTRPPTRDQACNYSSFTRLTSNPHWLIQ
jgi:hypothetical protein